MIISNLQRSERIKSFRLLYKKDSCYIKFHNLLPTPYGHIEPLYIH